MRILDERREALVERELLERLIARGAETRALKDEISAPGSGRRRLCNRHPVPQHRESVVDSDAGSIRGGDDG